MPADAAASIMGAVGKQLNHSTPSRLRMFATASTTLMVSSYGKKVEP
jgi:hypothetical protein